MSDEQDMEPAQDTRPSMSSNRFCGIIAGACLLMSISIAMLFQPQMGVIDLIVPTGSIIFAVLMIFKAMTKSRRDPTFVLRKDEKRFVYVAIIFSSIACIVGSLLNAMHGGPSGCGYCLLCFAGA